ncbi:MAG: response regulator [Bdellovibrionales bacterium]|nr:response regulator [Bdellovibrionales bacterium]
MSGKKLLVADDSLTIQKVIRLALSHEGYEIQAVSDGVEALEQLLLFRPNLVLIDVSLPGKSATEVKAFADEKPELSSTRFILMSSAFEQIDEAAILKSGFHGRLTKPFDPAHLRKVLVDCLGQGSNQKAPAPPAPSTKDFPPLWETQSAPPPFPGQPPSAASSGAGDETDIRKLTQSTLQMAGFNEFEWSVTEGAKKESPSTVAPTMASMEMPSFDSEPSLPPLPRMSSSSMEPKESDPLDLMDPDAKFNKSLTNIELPEKASTGSPMMVDEVKMEALVEKLVQERVEAALAEISKEMLPQIAERLIKQEIHRLLDEGP